MVERRFLGELIELENRLSRGYGDGQFLECRAGEAGNTKGPSPEETGLSAEVEADALTAGVSHVGLELQLRRETHRARLENV